MPKILAAINKKSGKLTMKVEGCPGESCKELTRPIEEGLGMKEPERELLPDYYQATQQQNEQQQGT